MKVTNMRRRPVETYLSRTIVIGGVLTANPGGSTFIWQIQWAPHSHGTHNTASNQHTHQKVPLLLELTTQQSEMESISNLRGHITPRC